MSTLAEIETAPTVAETLWRPEIMDGFRMPHGNNDSELAGRARAFIKAVGELISTGMGIRKSLDALVNNLVKGNATITGEWTTASHVQCQGARKSKPTDGGTAVVPKP